MATNNHESKDKEDHRRLANLVKGVHAGLRQKFKESGDFMKTWDEHCQNTQRLSEYADAMQHLAIDHWTKRPDTRIDWCRNTLLEYFLHGGLAKVLEKDARRETLQRQKREATSATAPTENHVTECEACSLKNRNCSDGTWINSSVNNNGSHIRNKPYDIVYLPFEGKIRLLDVGSCFNPFLEYKEFLAIGIDIFPAKPTVYRCDFLNLETTETLQVAWDTLDTYLSNLKDPIEKLPKDSFHVVVFSLLLEYFPAPYQRWLCCQKARKVLMKNGLLVIITPDSHQQHRNAPMIKSWRTGIESMGFSRWRYVKQEHLHCMAFRKVPHARDRDRHLVGEVTPDMLYIPQDSVSDEDQGQVDSGGQTTAVYTTADEEFFRQTVRELPGFESGDDVD